MQAEAKTPMDGEMLPVSYLCYMYVL
jgi:hypothetical protein